MSQPVLIFDHTRIHFCGLKRILAASSAKDKTHPPRKFHSSAKLLLLLSVLLYFKSNSTVEQSAFIIQVHKSVLSTLGMYPCDNLSLLMKSLCVTIHILVQYSDKFMHNIVKFLIVLLRPLLLCFCTVLLSEGNTIQCHA